VIKIDPHSTTWLNIKEYINARMATLRAQLESDLPVEQVPQIRAQLKELKNLVSETEVEVPLIDVEPYEIPG